MKNILALLTGIFIASLSLNAEAYFSRGNGRNYYRGEGRGHYHPRPNPSRPYYPRPAPRPYPGYQLPPYYQVTCYARGMANGLTFYGISPDYNTASYLAMSYCQSSGQYCQFLGCQ
jgi:hypothetical protein